MVWILTVVTFFVGMRWSFQVAFMFMETLGESTDSGWCRSNNKIEDNYLEIEITENPMVSKD